MWRAGCSFCLSDIAAGWRPGSAFSFFDRTAARGAGWRPGSAFRFFEIASTPLFAFASALDVRCRLAAAARFKRRLVSASGDNVTIGSAATVASPTSLCRPDCSADNCVVCSISPSLSVPRFPSTSLSIDCNDRGQPPPPCVVHVGAIYAVARGGIRW